MSPRRPASRCRVVSIDGPAAAGKSTTAADVARRLGFVHLNSGLLYRALAWKALSEDWDAKDDEYGERIRSVRVELERKGDRLDVIVDGERPGRTLSGPRVSSGVSSVASRAEVREAVLERLRRARRQFDLVCDGRDIGTTVFPDADLKVFLVADPAERARRRLIDHGVEPTPEAVASEAARLERRDRADATRELSPLRKAEDAVEMDTTHRTREEVVGAIVALASARGIEARESAATPPPRGEKSG